MNRLTTFAAALLISTAAFAHDPRLGPNGGLKVDAGPWHAELVADGSTRLKVFLFDANDTPVAAAGFSANAILVIDGKPARFTLAPDGDILAGDAPSPVAPGVKGAIQLTAPDGSTAQAKY
jgi:hypothetical protein